ncbi:MAG: biliverdin-producing heme oxygenase [Flavobacteriaceae bacterium]|nr:biliverdin-producing heme oxygenase [Flavobacteriaceae bacterium]
MISKILKEKTHFEHILLEEKLHAERIVQGSYNMADYRQLIEINYRFLQNYEAEVHDAIPLTMAEKMFLAQRKKFPAIQQDAAQLGLVISNETAHKKITNSAQALGIMYVMEGSSLGGNMIQRHLKKNPEFDQIQFKFLGFYGKSTAEMWKNFIQTIDQEIKTEADQHECILGAELAYTYLLGFFD